MSNYKDAFTTYVQNHQLTYENFDEKLREIGYQHFFNDITVACLGKADHIETKGQHTASTLTYLPDAVKETLVENFDILYVSMLYYGIIANGDIEFNYPNYPQFLKDLVKIRLDIKSDIKNNEQTRLLYTLIKIYMNVVYGMLDNPRAVISTNLENPRELVVKNSKKVMLKLVSFFLNKSLPVYYIETDMMFVPHIGESMFDDLKKYFRNECGEFIDLDISDICVDEYEKNQTSYIIAKKRRITAPSGKTHSIGLQTVNDKKTLVQNKKFFGRNHNDIFPEYAIW